MLSFTIGLIEAGFKGENLSTNPLKLVSRIYNPQSAVRALESVVGGLVLVNSGGWVGFGSWVDTLRCDKWLLVNKKVILMVGVDENNKKLETSIVCKNVVK